MSIKVYVDLRSQPCRSLVIFLKNSDISFDLEYIKLAKGEQMKPEFSSLFPLHKVPAIEDGDYLLAETSQPCRSLIIFLKNSDISFEMEYIDIAKGEQKKPEYTNLFPLHTVPAIKDGDYLLAETVAIFRYLTTKYKGKFPEHWYPTELKARGRVDEYLAFHHSGIRGVCMPVHISEVLGSLLGLAETPEERRKYENEKLTHGLDNFEKAFLKDNDYLCGNEISFADVMAVSEFLQLTLNGRDVTEERPRLKAFVERVRARLNPTFDEVHAELYAWRDFYLKK